MIFGAEHMKDPTHIQNKDIEIAFNDFKLTIVLVEGRLGFLIPYLMNPVKGFGEMGLAAGLAKKIIYPYTHGKHLKLSK